MAVVKSYQENQKVQKHRWTIAMVVGLFTFMSTLDASIVNIAIPTISKEIDVPMNQAEWIVSIYLIVICVCLLLFGKIGDSIGKIKVFHLGTIIFVIGSLLCGFPHSLGFLIFARAVQAIGASMTMATNNGIITEIFPLNERGRALGINGSFVSLGSIAGPGIGGLILAQFSWSYIFWINVPIGIVTILLGLKYLPKDITKTGEKIDQSGFTLFTIFILSLFGGIFIGQEIGFTKLPILSLFLVAIISLFVFVRIEMNKKNPLVPLKIFTNRTFTISLITATIIFTSNFFINVIMPFYLQNARGLKPDMAGLLLMVFPFVMVIGAPISGYLTDKIGPQLLTLSGLIILTINQGLCILLQVSDSLAFFILIVSIMGVGNALFQSPNNTVVMSSVTQDNLGIAGSLNSLAREIGMVLGVALSTTLLYSAMSYKMGEHITTYIENRSDVFIYGLHVAFLGSFIMCLIATLLTLSHYFRRKKK